MAKRFIVIGMGQFGASVVESLGEQGCDVVAIDRDMDAIDRVKRHATHAVQLDATDPQALRSQGATECDAAVVAIGEDFESAALTVACLKELGVKKIVARAGTERRGRILLNAGATEVIGVEREMGMRIGRTLATPPDTSS